MRRLKTMAAGVLVATAVVASGASQANAAAKPSPPPKVGFGWCGMYEGGPVAVKDPAILAMCAPLTSTAPWVR